MMAIIFLYAKQSISICCTTPLWLIWPKKLLVQNYFLWKSRYRLYDTCESYYSLWKQLNPKTLDECYSLIKKEKSGEAGQEMNGHLRIMASSDSKTMENLESQVRHLLSQVNYLLSVIQRHYQCNIRAKGWATSNGSAPKTGRQQEASMAVTVSLSTTSPRSV